MSRPVIVDLFSAIATSTAAAIGYPVYFHHGHILEISNVVKQLGKDPDIGKRYPIISLEHDISKTHKIEGTEFECKMYIITLSDPNYLAEDRKELIFKPILTPLFEAFIHQIARSGKFEQQTDTEVNENCRSIDRYFWGRKQVMGNDANIFGDWVDCIEIESLKLTALNIC